MSAAGDRRLWSAVLEQADGSRVSVRHVCAAIVAVIGVDGVAAALATSATVRETAYADDDVATGLEELTLTLGEGPQRGRGAWR